MCVLHLCRNCRKIPTRMSGVSTMTNRGETRCSADAVTAESAKCPFSKAIRRNLIFTGSADLVRRPLRSGGPPVSGWFLSTAATKGHAAARWHHKRK